jgi:Na+/melibiose symporter-like transporter
MVMIYISAGLVLLSGQVADALATPIVGILSDRSKLVLLSRCVVFRHVATSASAHQAVMLHINE